MAALPPGYQQEPGHRAKWLWRTLRAAELASLDPRQVLADAVGERNLTGARDIDAVIDARIRRRVGALVPAPIGSWAAQVPAIADPDRLAYIRQIAALMDCPQGTDRRARRSRQPPMGGQRPRARPRRPGGPIDMAAARAASIGAYRELSGYDHPAEAPTVGRSDRDRLGLGPPVDRRRAPAGPCRRLRRAPGCAPRRRRSSHRPSARRRRPGHPAAELAASYQALHHAYRERETVLAANMADRADWGKRSAGSGSGRGGRRRTSPPHPGQPGPRCVRRTRSRRPPGSARQRPLHPGWLTSREQNSGSWTWPPEHRESADKLAERQSLMIPAEDPDYKDLGRPSRPEQLRTGTRSSSRGGQAPGRGGQD